MHTVPQDATYIRNAVHLGEWIERLIDEASMGPDGMQVRVSGSEGFGQQYDLEVSDQETGVEYQVTIMRVSNAHHHVNDCPAGCEYYVLEDGLDEMVEHLREEHDWDDEQIAEYFGTDAD